MLLVEDCVAPTLGGFSKALSDFPRCCEVDPREFVHRDITKLDETEDRPGFVALEPRINRPMVISLTNVRLGQSPTTVLASLDGDLQESVVFRNNEVVLRLVRAVLDRDIQPAPGELCSSDRLSCHSDMPRIDPHTAD